MDLLNGVSIRIGGELTKQNTLPISALVKLANNFQDLVNEVVKSGIADETTIKMEYFQIGLSGFKVGSAVPEFRFIRQNQVVLGADIPAQQEKVSNRLAKIISISSSGDFRELKQEFKNTESCNGIIRSLHGFINSVGNAPLSIVDKELKPEYTIQRFSKKAMESLIVKIEEIQLIEIKDEAKILLAKIEERVGRGRKKIIHTYGSKITPTYDPAVINCKHKQYLLRYPLMSKVLEIDDKIVIENQLLGIYAWGDDMDQAEEMFAEEFDYMFIRYNELEQSQLSHDVLFIKNFLDQIIASHG